MSTEVQRPCGAADLVALTPPYREGWGRPLDHDPVPWEACGGGAGFEHAFTVVEDDGWGPYVLEEEAGVALRYVLVPRGEGWELRAGRTVASAMAAGTGGMHQHMFSARERRAAEAAGQAIRSGYVYAISPTAVRIG